MRARTAIALIAVTLSGILVLSGCSTDSLAKDYGSGGTNFTDNSGLPVVISAAKRIAAIDFTGTTVDGKTLTASEPRGPVTVVNFWYANCAPCRAEAPFLQGLYEKYQADGVKFIGVNIFDQPEGALSFEKNYGITYPSVMDVDSGAARIAFAGAVAPTATPTTFVLDAKGRIAARIVGQLESQSILNTLISDTLAESK
ncbi:TlpA family protein disulfide reductase [Frigoribacterium sp. CG_9.8]|uniref:TlpA family protein disulfide reductase n=1 Tax=Frigoribacterium sp. CG_9.8 TaxID=2787733 RepID=UPI001A2E23FA|nr:thiol-disulfide isomerase/thioredoxin [Frigoribacterium sp. CG_9.8]